MRVWRISIAPGEGVPYLRHVPRFVWSRSHPGSRGPVMQRARLTTCPERQVPYASTNSDGASSCCTTLRTLAIRNSSLPRWKSRTRPTNRLPFEEPAQQVVGRNEANEASDARQYCIFTSDRQIINLWAVQHYFLFVQFLSFPDMVKLAAYRIRLLKRRVALRAARKGCQCAVSTSQELGLGI